MSTTNLKEKRVLVTGGTGYIASWIVKYLLEAGAEVRITVRDKQNKSKYDHLVRLAAEAEGRLDIYEADLMQAGSFREAMAGCEFVFHTASPFRITKIRDAMKDLILPAVQGTANVLNTASEVKSVRRVILTSSIAAIYGDAIEASQAAEGHLTEEIWNTSSTITHQPYSYSKTAAEREAWKIARAQDRWDLITINPGLVMGPSLTSRTDSTSIDIMISITSGKYRYGIPDLHFALADVRDIARAHILAATHPEASGRFIIAAREISFPQIAEMLRSEYGKTLPLPKKTLPNGILYFLGPFMGFSWKYLRLNLGKPMPFSHARSRELLGMTYTDVKTTLLDHVTQLKHDKLIMKS